MTLETIVLQLILVASVRQCAPSRENGKRYVAWSAARRYLMLSDDLGSMPYLNWHELDAYVRKASRKRSEKT